MTGCESIGGVHITDAPCPYCEIATLRAERDEYKRQAQLYHADMMRVREQRDALHAERDQLVLCVNDRDSEIQALVAERDRLAVQVEMLVRVLEEHALVRRAEHMGRLHHIDIQTAPYCKCRWCNTERAFAKVTTERAVQRLAALEREHAAAVEWIATMTADPWGIWNQGGLTAWREAVAAVEATKEKP